MITVQSWSRSIALGTAGVVAFTLSSAVPVTQIEADLIGNGRPAEVQMHGDDLRAVVALRFVPEVAGTFSLQLRAQDAAGCADATGLQRDVEVVRP